MDGCVDVGVLVILYYDFYLFEWGLAVVQWLLYNQERTLFCLWLVMENWDKLVNFSAKCYTLLFTNAYYCFSHTYASWSTYIIIELFWFKNWRVPLLGIEENYYKIVLYAFMSTITPSTTAWVVVKVCISSFWCWTMYSKRIQPMIFYLP